MSQFSPTDVGLAGFRFARENLRSVIVWAVLMLATNLLSLVVTAAMAGPAMAELQALLESPQPDISALMDVLQRLTPASLVTMLISAVITGVLYASASRMVLTPGADGPLGKVAFGADEVRQILLVIILNLIFLGVVMAAGFLVGILAVIGGVAGGVLGSLLAFLAAIPVIIFLSIRLSLAAPLAFETRRIALRDAWDMTRGHFWNLFLAYLIAGVMGIIVWVLGLAVAVGVVSVVFGFNGLAQASAPEMSSVAALFTGPLLVYQGLMAGFLALAYINILTPGPVVYSQLKARPGVFD
ncbi:hypothetical protein GVN21_06565 [Caulobacter sp. SLTY]|uniref:hypothetical protein n=1 Tax=Caulobacter sp. SLTY TaxID=2683262 RepID=UPI0014120A47|nr:hypothetical protein [Caulobacter sp. SLTY]NBB15015.1 hypothetical protein [Caulobacter sp. SLTY]